MRDKNSILLEQAYQAVCENTSAIVPNEDAAQDAELERSIKQILLGAIRREELNEYSLERGSAIKEIMMVIQKHVDNQIKDLQANNQDEAPEMSSWDDMSHPTEEDEQGE